MKRPDDWVFPSGAEHDGDGRRSAASVVNWVRVSSHELLQKPGFLRLPSALLSICLASCGLRPWDAVDIDFCRQKRLLLHF